MNVAVPKTKKPDKNALPQKILSRKDEITADFLVIAERHLDQLLHGEIPKRMAAKDFAEQLFIHPRHLTNTLKLTLNTSPCEIMEDRLIVIAQNMLAETDLSVADISQRFGYNDTTNFIKFFKGLAGITPLQYRKLSKIVKS